ncbi:FAD-binding protein [Chloroflexota bacterium]
MKEELVQCDVLCIGGGIAGLMAAIRASELGAEVVVADKADTLRSGSGAVGCDHFHECYIPEVHGSDIEPFLEETRHAAVGAPRTELLRVLCENAFEIVKMWDRWGIPMKYNGKWEFAGHAFPGHLLPALKYSGMNQKQVLTEQALKRGVKIMNWVMVFELLGNADGVIGALGIGTREEKLIVFQAKGVFLGTGACARLYPPSTPGWLFNVPASPFNTGDGRAMAYRLGAELTDIEMTGRWAGPKYFARSGKATWVGVLRDPHDKPVGPFITQPDKRYGDPAADVYTNMFDDYMKSGKGPIYMDCRGISDGDLEYMVHWLKHEGNLGILEHLTEEGIDLRKTAVEFATYEMGVRGGVNYNKKGETSIKGLYAAGDEFGVGVSGAAVIGWIAGEGATKYAKGAKSPNLEREKAKIEENKSLLQQLRGREVGASWQEVNIALQKIIYDYAGFIRSETLLVAGLSYIRRLKEKASNTMIARNQHELGRCLEALNLLDMGELVFITANERKETRGRHVRTDYPFTNPLLDTYLLIKKTDGVPVTKWKETGH